MRKLFAILVGLLVLLPIAEARRTSPPIQYITSGQTATGQGTAGASLTPNGTAWASSAWVDLITAGGNLFVTGIYVHAAVVVIYEVEIGTSPDGVVWTPIGVYSGQTRASGPNVGVPLGGITNTEHVGVRFRKSGTSTTAIDIGITYITGTVNGYISSSEIASISYPVANQLAVISGSGVAWANGSWTELIASTATEWSIFDVAIHGASVNEFCEFDIGTGAALSEVVQFTLPCGVGSSGHVGQFWKLYPFWSVNAGTRLAVRLRLAGTTQRTYNFKFSYYPDFNISSLKTHSQLKLFPTAASGSSVSDAGWTQFIASTSNPIAVLGINIGTGGSLDANWQVGIGGAGSEVVIDQAFFLIESSNAINPNAWLGFPRLIGTGQRVSVTTNTVGASNAIKLMYWDNPDFTYIVNTGHETRWLTGNIAGAAVAYNNSSWGELVASTTDQMLITSIGFNDGVTGTDLEIDLGIGAVASETAVWTTKLFNWGSNANQKVDLQTPLRIPDATRVSVRFRKSGTSTANWVFWANNLIDTITNSPPGFPALLLAP